MAVYNLYGTDIDESAISEFSSRTLTLEWELGSIDGTGKHDSTTNIRTKTGITLSSGETLEIVCTNSAMNTAIYVYKDDTWAIVVDGWRGGYCRFVFSDWRYTYYIRASIQSGTITTSMGDRWTAKIKTKPIYPISTLVPKTVPASMLGDIGFRREFSYISPLLNWQRKDLNGSGQLVDSTTRCVAELPNAGCVEVRQNMYTGVFKVAKVVGSTVTWLTGSGWSYYVCRYRANGDATYYVVVGGATDGSTAPDGSLTITTDDAKTRIGIYLYTDVGDRMAESTPKLYGKHVAFIGDSITQGRFRKQAESGLNWTASKRFGDLIAERLNDMDYGNFGIGGALVSGSDWKSLVNNCGKVSGYDVVFVCGGTNDYGNNVSQSNFLSAYRTVIDTLKSNNTSVIAVTPVFRTSMTGANTQGLYLYNYVDYIKQVATEKEIPCIDLYTRTNDGAFISFCPDGLHPDENGHKLMADHILEACEEVIA